MRDIVETLRAYLEGDNSVIMSIRVVNEVIDEILRLREECQLWQRAAQEQTVRAEDLEDKVDDLLREIPND